MSRVLVSDDGRFRTYRVNDVQGKQVGTDVERTPTAAETNATTLQQQAQNAIQANVTYLAITTPTPAQVAAQVNRLTRECSALIRLLLNQTDDTSGT